MRTRTFVFASFLPSLIVFGCATAENGGGTLGGGKHDSATLDEGFDVIAPGDDSSTTTDSGTHPGDSSTGKDTGHTGTDTGGPSIDTGTPPPFDSGTPIDTGTVGSDTGTGPEGGPSQGGTTGKLCTTSTDCDVLGDGVQGCTSDVGFSTGTLYPTPVCIGTTCTPDPTGASIAFCDGLDGICLPVTGGGICLPTCTFTSTTSPTGCRGKDACNVYGWDAASDPTGYGYCFGGCTADADCIAGGSCQTETGLCVTSKVSYTKSVGTACTSTDASATPPACDCLYSTTTNKGYCTQFCIFGGTPSCGTGYSCDTLLPSSGTTIFSGSPTSLAGSCLKNCTTDSDCTAINSTCKQSAGVASKTCQPF